MSKTQTIFNLSKDANQKKLAVLIDPDKVDSTQLEILASKINESKVDLVFVGGSLLINDNFEATVRQLKQSTNCPVIIFPGHPMQISNQADAILLLSLISGRNPDLLIGQHVHAAPHLKKSGIDILSTGYILIDGGKSTTVSYISNTQPIPPNKPEIAACTALAGELLGLKNIYLEAGSGAENTVSIEVVKAVKATISIPLMVGGGIRTAKQASEISKAGADIIVVGSAIEDNSNLIQELVDAVHSV